MILLTHLMKDVLISQERMDFREKTLQEKKIKDDPRSSEKSSERDYSIFLS